MCLLLSWIKRYELIALCFSHQVWWFSLSISTKFLPYIEERGEINYGLVAFETSVILLL